jgi:hypothetical protein
MNKEITFRKIVNFIAFCGVILVALSLTIGKIWPSVAYVTNMIAGIIASVIMAISAFYFAKSKRNVGYMIVWIICAVIILVFTFWK